MEHLAKDELLRFLAVARAVRERDWLMFLVQYQHGLRDTEVVGGWLMKRVDKQKQKVWYPGITRASIADGYLTVARLKGSLKTVQPLVEDANPLLSERTALESLASNSPFLTPIFALSRVQYFRLFRAYAKRAGIPAHCRHPHVLKHSLAMHTIHDAGIENVRQYLGHTSIASTGAYLKVSDADASLAIAHAAGR